MCSGTSIASPLWPRNNLFSVESLAYCIIGFDWNYAERPFKSGGFCCWQRPHILDNLLRLPQASSPLGVQASSQQIQRNRTSVFIRPLAHSSSACLLCVPAASYLAVSVEPPPRVSSSYLCSCMLWSSCYTDSTLRLVFSFLCSDKLSAMRIPKIQKHRLTLSSDHTGGSGAVWILNKYINKHLIDVIYNNPITNQLYYCLLPSCNLLLYFCSVLPAKVYIPNPNHRPVCWHVIARECFHVIHRSTLWTIFHSQNRISCFFQLRIKADGNLV